MFLSILALNAGRVEWSWLFIGLATGVKFQSIILTPIIFLVTLRRYHVKKLILGTVIGVVSYVLLWLPLLLHDPTLIVEVCERNANWMPFLSCNAFNLWEIVGILKTNYYWFGLFLPDSPSNQFLSDYYLGTIFFFAYLAVVLYWLNKDPSSQAIYFASFLTCLGFFVLPTRIHERYLFYAFPFLASQLFRGKGIKIVYIFLSTTFFLNLWYVLRYPFSTLFFSISPPHPFLSGNEVAVMISLVNIFILFFSLALIVKKDLMSRL